MLFVYLCKNQIINNNKHLDSKQAANVYGVTAINKIDADCICFDRITSDWIAVA